RCHVGGVGRGGARPRPSTRRPGLARDVAQRHSELSRVAARPPSTETNLWLSAAVLLLVLGVVTIVGDWGLRVDIALWSIGAASLAALTWLVQMRTRSLHRLPTTLSATD